MAKSATVIDTHCHLTFPDYAGRVDEVVDAARGAGVFGMISISTTTRDCREALGVAQRYDDVWCSSGVHPLYSAKGPHEWGAVLEVARSPKCVAWGELGLDNHYDEPVGALQREVLTEQLAHIESWRREDERLAGLPVIVHCREAFEDLIPILRASGVSPERFVFHCFTGGPAEMRLVLDFGAMVSFTGVVTFPGAPEVREAAALVPLDRVMVETDAPFLTPAPHRKVRPNEPRFARVTAEFLAAEVYRVAWPEFEAAIDANTARFFGIRAGDPAGRSAVS
ncbi:MAG: TatD family hydrolase [Planctomycetota bacterium]